MSEAKFNLITDITVGVVVTLLVTALSGNPVLGTFCGAIAVAFT